MSATNLTDNNDNQEIGGNVTTNTTGDSSEFKLVDESPVEVIAANPGVSVAGSAAPAPAADPVAAASVDPTVAPAVDTAPAESLSVSPSVEPVETTAPGSSSDISAPADAASNVEVTGSPVAGADSPAAAAAPAPKAADSKPKGPKPGLPKPKAPKPFAPKAGPAQIQNPALIAAAEAFGEIGPEGQIFVLDTNAEGGKRQIGTASPSATPSENFSIFVQRYLVLDGKVKAFEARLTDPELNHKDAEKQLTRFEKDLAEPAIIGDLTALRDTVAALKIKAAEHKVEMDALAAAAKEQALAERTALVEKAEALIAGDHSKIQWKTTGEEMRNLMEQWKVLQKSPVRINRNVEADLWQRFRTARSTFDTARRQYFNELDENNAAVKAKKEAIVKEAEKLSASTEWGPTSAAYRDLLTKWKAAGRAGRKDDDALWAQFRAAQDKFFAARDASNKASDAEQETNLVAKLAILADAEKILPVKDLAAAKAALRGIQDRWEAVGNVPRASLGSVEGRMKAVEQAIRDAEQAQWKRSNPETKARAEGAAAQLLKAISGLEDDIAAAKKSGNAKKVADLEAALAARQAWLEQVEKAAADHR